MLETDSLLSDRRVNMHWASAYIGKPYEHAARGPDKFDCWGLVWAVYKSFGIYLPEFPGITLTSPLMQCNVILQNISEDWVDVGMPFDCAAVGMSKKAAIHHVGVYIAADGGKIVHATPESGVVASTERRLRVEGFRVIRYFRHKLWPTS
jgi:cell wall-associated NlpC family hydrolase